MATAQQLAQFRQVQDDLSSVAFKDLQSILSEFKGVQDGVTVRNALIKAVPVVMNPYVSASAQFAAVWYEDLRKAANQPGRFTSTLADSIPIAQYEALIRYAVGPLFKESDATVFSLLSGQAQKVIAGGARDTIQANINKEKQLVGYQRVPSPGCCAFCALVAGRGAVYRSAETAGGVSGRGVDAAVTAGKAGGQGKGVKLRGSQGVGSKYHDFCHCIAAPVFTGDTWSHSIRDHYSSLYEGGSNLSEALGDMREAHGLK